MNRFKILTIICMIIWSAVAHADIEVIFANESDLPYALSPSKYSNSSSKYSNSISKYSNSGTKYSNSSFRYENSPSKYSNSKSGDQRLLFKKGHNYSFVGYYVWGDEGIINFFSPNGERLFYNPPETSAIFDGIEGEFAGALAKIDSEDVLVVTEKGQIILLKNGIRLNENTGVQKKSTANSYLVEFAYNDEIFVINGETFKAQTYCLGWDRGDSVVFTEGDLYGACVSAELFNLNRKESCKVWCE